jgi:hypothetical protein
MCRYLIFAYFFFPVPCPLPLAIQESHWIAIEVIDEQLENFKIANLATKIKKAKLKFRR